MKIRLNDGMVIAILFVVAFSIRWIAFWRIPGGMNIDESYAGYLSYSILNYGIDTAGVHNPIYFEAWGDGMNALNSYLMLPFIKLFGLNAFTVRLPQEILASITVVVFYLLAKKMYNKQIAIVALFTIAINPWHIMLSRWGLESALAPGFLLLGLYFFVLGMEKTKFLILSAVSYGLGLYCYATIWPIVPMIIGADVIYAVYCKKVKWDRYCFISCVLLFLLALPLLLFLLVNMGYLNEIKTPLFTINKMVGFRGGEISLGHFGDKVHVFMKAVLGSDDGLNHNTIPYFGLYYGFSIPFIFVGLVKTMRETMKSISHRSYCSSVFLLVQLIFCMFLGMVLVSVNITRINSIFLIMIMLLAVGLYEILSNVRRWISITVLCCYITSFSQFSMYYFTTYSKEISETFGVGLDDAIAYADRLSDERGQEIAIFDAAYSQVLYCSKLPVIEYIDTVNRNIKETHWWVHSFTKYLFNLSLNDLGEYVYITRCDKKDLFLKNGYTVREFDTYIVAY